MRKPDSVKALMKAKKEYVAARAKRYDELVKLYGKGPVHPIKDYKIHASLKAILTNEENGRYHIEEFTKHD